MPRGDKSAYTDKQERQAEHIEESEKEQGRSEEDAERIAWATVNKQDGGAKGKRSKSSSRTRKSAGSREGAGSRESSVARKSAGPRKSTGPRTSADPRRSADPALISRKGEWRDSSRGGVCTPFATER